MRLDVALIARHPGLSRRKAREVIEKGQVTLDGAAVLEAGLEVSAQADLAWDPNRKARPRVRCSLKILYEDASLLVVDKPAGLLAVPSTTDAPDEDTALRRIKEYEERLNPRRPYVGVVHRLDRDTSGALAFALDPEARQGLRTLFREHRIERRYRALVEGRPSEDSGTIDAPLRDAYEGGRRRVARPGEPSHAALTRWTVVERFRRATLLEVDLGTGRQHQIRVHLAHLGMPVVGDRVYGAARPLVAGARRQMLHARRLGFVHPVSGEPVETESPLPEDFRRLLQALRKEH